MAKRTKKALVRRIPKRAIVLVLFLVLLYVILPRFSSFRSSLHAINDARLGPLWAAGIFTVATYFFAAGIYCLLAPPGLNYGRTLLVQGSTAFANRLLPAGLGGVTLNVRYLRKSGHTIAQSLAVVAANNLIGIVGHLILLVVVVITASVDVTSHWHTPRIDHRYIIVIVLTLLLIGGGILINKSRRRLDKLLEDIYGYIRTYRQHPLRLLGALVFSVGLTSCYVAAFYFCTHALSLHVSLEDIFIVFTGGVIVGTVTPTPGGLGGMEAGLVAGLVAYGVTPATALAAVLTYRLLTYWLPIVPGFLAFLTAQSYIA